MALKWHEISKFRGRYSQLELAMHQAEELGVVVVKPEPTQLFLDIDSEENLRAFLVAISNRNVREDLLLQAVHKTISKGGHLHVYLTCGRNFTPFERMAYQLLLGSDDKREILAYMRIICTEAVPTLFFETPNSQKKLVAEEGDDLVTDGLNIIHIEWPEQTTYKPLQETGEEAWAGSTEITKEDKAKVEVLPQERHRAVEVTGIPPNLEPGEHTFKIESVVVDDKVRMKVKPVIKRPRRGAYKAGKKK